MADGLEALVPSETAPRPRPSASRDREDASGTPQAGRKKRWTNRVRTGCITCRVRRVKCDETRPICKRCIIGGRECTGINYGTPSEDADADADADVDAARSPAASTASHEDVETQLTSQREASIISHDSAVALTSSPPHAAVARDPLPHGWHFSEACEYYNEVILPSRIERQIFPNDFHRPVGYTKQKFSPPPDHQHTVIMIALAHRIAHMSHAGGRDRPTVATAQRKETADLQMTFYSHLGEAINGLNQHLVKLSLDCIIGGLRRIANIVSAERYMVAMGWRPHAEGFLALVKYGGGIDNVVKAFPPMRLATYYFLVITNVADTTSPRSDQGASSLYPSLSDTRKIYSSTIYPSFPCPTKLFFTMIRITKLRQQLHNQHLPFHLQSDALQVFDDIDGFMPETWEEAYPVPDTEEVHLIARIYQVAMALYGVLSLYAAQTAWFESFNCFSRLRSSTHVAGEPVGTSLQRELLRLLATAMGLLQNRESLSWPLTVVGVGAAQGSSADRTFIEESLFKLGSDDNSDVGPIDARGLLLDFWKSGKTGWDDCFPRPALVLS